MSMFTAILWFFNFLLCVTFPSFVRSFTNVGTFVYYAAWCIVGFFCILFFVPETGGQTLEALDARFSIPTRAFMKFGLHQLRYAILHGVFRRRMKKPTLEPSDVPNILPPREMTMKSDWRDSMEPRPIPLDVDVERMTTTTHD